jgi:hypothetical protein
VIRVAEHTAWEEDGDAVLVMDVRTGDVVRLDGTSRALWLLAPGLTPDALVGAAATAYGLSPDDIRDEVQAWLTSMAAYLDVP